MPEQPIRDIDTATSLLNAEIKRLAGAVDRLGVEFAAAQNEELKFRTALGGVPGVSEGAVQEMRKAIEKQRLEFVGFQQSLPNIINAAIEVAAERQSAGRYTGIRNWWWATGVIAASSLISSLVSVLVHLH
jgi:hypothetical protein